MIVAEGLHKLDRVRRMQLAGEIAHKVIGCVMYTSGSSEDMTYGILGQSSINTTAYKRRRAPNNPGFGISGR